MAQQLSAYVEENILAANPVELIRILYQAAIAEVRCARRNLAAGEIRRRSDAIMKAWEIVLELSRSLNSSAGEDIARRLSALYEYIQTRLLEANATQSDEPLAEVLTLLCTLAEGWEKVPSAAPVNRRRADTRNTPAASAWAVSTLTSGAEYAPQSWSL